jgi:hypothetical protein
VGGGASLTQEWRGPAAAWAEQMVKRRGIGAVAPRGVVPLGPWDTPPSHYGGEHEWDLPEWAPNPRLANSHLPVTAGAILWFDPSFRIVIHQAAAILDSDLSGEAKGRELQRLIRPGMSRDEVQALLGDRLVRAAILVHDPPSTRIRMLCPELCLSISFQLDCSTEVHAGLTDMSSWGFPAFPPDPPPCFTFMPGWAR